MVECPLETRSRPRRNPRNAATRDGEHGRVAMGDSAYRLRRRGCNGGAGRQFSGRRDGRDRSLHGHLRASRWKNLCMARLLGPATIRKAATRLTVYPKVNQIAITRIARLRLGRAATLSAPDNSRRKVPRRAQTPRPPQSLRWESAWSTEE